MRDANIEKIPWDPKPKLKKSDNTLAPCLLFTAGSFSGRGGPSYLVAGPPKAVREVLGGGSFLVQEQELRKQPLQL